MSYRTFIAIFVGSIFILQSSLPATAQSVSSLPSPGVQVRLSADYAPVLLKAVKVHPDNPFEFDFIIDPGQSQLSEEDFKQETQKLIRYFLASLTIPENDMWVNLSPYEKNRIVPDSFGVTEMGRDLLAQDYILKQITATLLYPEEEVGKKFWERVYEMALEKFGTSEIPTNTFNKVWVVPQKAVVYENGPTAYVDEAYLKVMLEEDYVALNNNSQKPLLNEKGSVRLDVNQLGSQIVREIILPELEKEVNQGTHFASLRQVYNSLILANWYKQRLKDSLLAKIFVDKNKILGVNIDDRLESQKIYQRYVEAFKKGVYNYIKEDYDPVSQESIPRKYFSGGMQLGMVSSSAVLDIRTGLPKLTPLGRSDFKIAKAEFELLKNRDSRLTQNPAPVVSWAQYSKVTLNTTLQTRLNQLDELLSLERPPDVDMLVLPSQGQDATEKIIALESSPLDLLKETLFYLEDIEAQQRRSGDRILLPEQSSKIKKIIAKLLALAFHNNQVTPDKISRSLGNTRARQIDLFMSGSIKVLDVSTIRNIVIWIERFGQDKVPIETISLRSIILEELKRANSIAIGRAILNLGKNKNLNLRQRLDPSDYLRLRQLSVGEIFTRESAIFNRLVAPLSTIWEEVLDENTDLALNLLREDRLEDALSQDLNNLSTNIERLRDVKGYTAGQVASLAGITLNVYSQYENGTLVSANPNHIIAISEGLQVDVNELWPADDLVAFVFPDDKPMLSEVPMKTVPALEAVARAPEKVSSSAVDNVGGIDLSADKTNVEIRGQGVPVDFNFDPQQIQNIEFDGFIPVIINIAPMTNLQLFLTEHIQTPSSLKVSKVN